MNFSTKWGWRHRRKTRDVALHWFDVDGARDYLSQQGGKKPSRRTVYNYVARGLKVARIGDTGRRFMFCTEWIDLFLQRMAERGPGGQAPEDQSTRRRAS